MRSAVPLVSSPSAAIHSLQPGPQAFGSPLARKKTMGLLSGLTTALGGATGRFAGAAAAGAENANKRRDAARNGPAGFMDHTPDPSLGRKGRASHAVWPAL